jgi:hypothetical protein
MAYDRVEPLYDGWLAAGVIAATTANLWSKHRYKPEDFVPRDLVRGQQSPEAAKSFAAAFAAAHNARLQQQGSRPNT